jgi:hypothetical protein
MSYAKLSHAQAPSLGGAGDFVLFTSVGAVGNTGISQVTGNVGTNSGAITGFGNVNGVMHQSNGSTAQAAADLIIAYNLLNNAIPTFFPAPLLGNGDTLEAGVYSISAVTTLNAELVLDAEGNPNAVFIFKIGAAFSTNPSSNIRLINGAQACNVFWKVEGLVSMGASTYFRGNIIANNAAIHMNVNDTLEGRALSTTGEITLNGSMTYIPSGCGSVPLTGPIAPPLGATACYVLFSASGPVTNAGVSYATGDIGTNVGLTTGFNPLFVNGTIHPIPDGSTSACATDLLVMYNYLNILPYDIQLLYPAQFGNNLVLTPHTYLLDAATTLTGNIILNAEGNANAVFVIKINGALSTSTYSNVILNNGAQARNVFWKVEGAVEINDYSVFNGTIIANNGAINFATGDTLIGRALTTTGAFTTAAIVATIPTGTCPTLPLPVSWLYFKGKPVNCDVQLEWGTSQEMNNDFYTIEKSKDGITFNLLAHVQPQSAHSSDKQAYSFMDNQPFSHAYYRISQTDLDGNRSNYSTIQVNWNTTLPSKAFHTLQGENLFVYLSDCLPGKGSIDLYSVNGTKVLTQNIIFSEGQNMFMIAKPVSVGVYIIQVRRNGESIYSSQFSAN